uniref:Uncharacterized protein n=1 Tax=Acrobeloides nanus TaxID=290746 RepID=A0A914EJC6_9BILA
MDNTTAFLKANASSLTDNQMDSVAVNILDIVGKLATNLEAAFKNPLQSDLNAALAYEKANYNNLFTYLPNDPSQIRYVDEMTQAEWAQEAAFLQQKALAKQLIASMNNMMDALEQALIQRMLASGQSSGTLSYTVNGVSLVISVGKPGDVFKNPLDCNDWTILDLHSFETPQWNHTILLQFQPIEGCQIDEDIWIFAAFQRLPGPLPQDNDWSFKIEDRQFSTYKFVPTELLRNRTGRFFIGLGITAVNNTENTTIIVDYNNFTVAPVNWKFTHDIPIDINYALKAIRKGGFYYSPDPVDMFDATGLTNIEVVGDSLVEFSTTHLTTFSAGLFTPEILPDFNYQYLVAMYPVNIFYYVFIERQNYPYG